MEAYAAIRLSATNNKQAGEEIPAQIKSEVTDG